MNILVQLSRILVGVLFIISGFIKANDTIGFSYKLEEYFEVFHMPFFAHYAVPLAMFICIFEIMVGVVLLVGTYARLNAWLLLLMIIFFTLLTGYSAITNKVTDCGCFGDAIKLKPFQSFIKDLVLLVFIGIIFIGHSFIKPIFNKTICHIGMFISLLVTTFFTIYTFMFLPKIDFLPYKVGNDIGKLMEIPEGAPRDEYEMIFIYEKGGQQLEFTAANLPADLDTYKFIDRKDKLIKEGYKPAIFDFKLYNDAGIDYTDSLLADKQNYKLILVQKSVFEGRKGIESQIAALADNWQKSGLTFWALSATAPEQVEDYRHEHQLAFPYYLMDATPIKSMVRSNPGLILLKGNTVIKKWSAYNLPSFETVKKYMN
ncbi:MAG: BT_3928 family protein [Bacteroidota bacterium]|jgi:uncharacterized membrane protein YphA (DoxX/SURF4 family)